MALAALLAVLVPMIEHAPAASPETTDRLESSGNPGAQPAQGPETGFRVKLPDGLPQHNVIIGLARVGEPVRVDLPGGVVAEVVAIGMHPSQGHPWWGPDGRPAVAPYHSYPSNVNPGPGFIVREIAVRWVAKPEGVTASYGIVGGGSAAAGKPRDKNGNMIDNLYTTAQAFPATAKTADVMFIVGTGTWETVASSDGRSDFAMGDSRYSVAFAKAAQRSEGLALSAAHNITEQDVRIVAIDRQGNEISAPSFAHGGRGFMQTTSVFPQLKIDDVQEFRVQMRSYHRVEVRNLSLVANEVTEPEVVPVGEQPVN
jgi:hypothetical protein